MKAISKKLLSLLIVLAMVLSMTPVISLPAAAALSTEVQTIIDTANSTEFAANFAKGGTVENVVCPVCGSAQTWTAVGSDGSISTTSTTSADAKHFYISESYTYTGSNFISVGTSGVKPCVYLNGQTVTLTKATMLVNNGVNLIGGTGKIIRQDGDATNGLFRTSGSGGADGNVSIYGGTYEDYDEDAPLFRDSTKNTWNFYGATFAFKGTTAHELYTKTAGVNPFTLHSGTIDCGVGTFTVTNGVTINLDGGSFTGTLNMNAGKLNIGSANVTGSVTVATGATITLTGAPTITGGGLTLGTDVYADVTDLATTSGAIAVNGALGDKIAVNGDADKAAMFTAPTGLAVTADGTDLVLSEAVVEPELPEWSSDIPTRINQWTDFYGTQFTGGNVDTAICPVCGATDVTWNDVSARPLPSAGDHLYFYSEGTTEITAGNLEQIGSSHAAPHCIYLNNYDYTSEGTFSVRDTLNIFDDPDVAGGSITDANSTNATATYEKYPSFRLFSGAKLNIYYGTYTCAQAKYTNTSDTVVNPNGTPLIGSYADGAQAYIYGATLQNTGYGEVLRAEDNITVEFESCELKGGSGYVDGEGVSYGGNIYMEDGTVTLKNTTVTGGTATNGSVYVGGGTLKLAGTTSIATNGLTLGTDVYADVTDLATTSGAIVVNGVKDQVIATNGDETKAGYFTVSGEDGLTVAVNDSNELYIKEPEAVDPGPAYEADDTTLEKIDKFTAYYADAFSGTDDVETANCPICGATNVTWEARSGSGAGAGFAITTEAKHFYLTETCGRTTQDMLGTEHAATGCIYLNNYTSTTYGRFLIKDTLNIFDDNQTAGGGITKIVNTYATAETPSKTGYLSMPMLAVTTGELNIYGGHFEVQQPVIAGFNVNGTPVIGASNSNSRVNIYGGTFANTGAGTVIEQSNGVVTMTGGTLQGGSGYVETTTTTDPDTSVETTTATGNLLGGNVYVTGGTFTLNGGTIENGTATSGGNVYVAAEGTFTLTTGNITGGKATDTDSENDGGGNVANFGTFTMNGGSITSGEATIDGGNVYNKGDCTLAGTISGGTATNGGNVYARAKFTTTAGANIFGGTATGDGGNIFIRTCSVDLLGGTITGGTATNGGNIYKYGSTAGTLKIDGATVSGGEATGDGATIYVNYRLNLVSGSIIGGTADGDGGAVYLAKGTMNMSGGSITGGVCGEDAEAPTEVDQVTGKGGNGGAVYVAADTTFNMTGGSITGGTVYPKQKGKADGGVTLTEGTGGAVLVKGTFNMSGENTSITGGTARDARGSGLYVTGTANLSGGTITGTNDVTDSALIVTGSSSLVNLSGDVDVLADNGQAIRVITSGTLNIDPSWTGTAYAMIARVKGWAMGEKIGVTSGEVFTADYVQCGTYDADGNWTACGEGNYFSGSLYQYTGNGEKLFALADGSLQVAGSAYVSGTDVTWCREATAIEQALAAASYDYLWLSGEVALNGKSIIVDLSGSKDVVLSGNGTVTGIDLANTDYKTNSDPLDIELLSTDTITVNSQYTFGGNRYIALNNGSYSFHCLDLKLTSISLRPNKDDLNGLYYKSTITCDTTLADAVEAYGVVLSKSDMPGDDFVTEVDANDRLVNGWTEVTDALGISETKTSVTVNSAIMQGIVKEATTATNATRGKTKVYANGYLAIANGEGELEYIMSNDTSEVIGCSLFDVLNAINTKWDSYANVHDNIGGFYKYWAERGLSAWDSELGSIAAHAATLQ